MSAQVGTSAEPTHVPCCSSHGIPMTCARYRRTHFVEVRPCCSADTEALRALADVDLTRNAAVLARHYWSEHGLSYGSPDRCACGAQTFPVAGDEDVMDRRARAFAGHQAEMLAAARAAVEPAA